MTSNSQLTKNLLLSQLAVMTTCVVPTLNASPLLAVLWMVGALLEGKKLKIGALQDTAGCDSPVTTMFEGQ